MTDTPSPPPEWTAAAARAGTELHLGTDFAGMDAAAWEQVCRRVGQILAGTGPALPPGWERALARAVGRPDPDELARDAADTVLAEKGEVFAPEDDA
ncbi:hypothetical protein [Methylobacterium sp. CM6257]|jgi:hypothetical protein